MLRINCLNNINFVTRPAFRAETAEAAAEKAQQTVSLDGIKALAAYNEGLINQEKCVLEPLEPIMKNPEDRVEGEKIYTSNGNLYSIVQEDEKTRTVFIPFEDDEGRIQSIIRTDKKTGNKILEQKNDYTDGKQNIYISEYLPESGKELRSANYIDGKTDYISKTIYGQNENRTNFSYFGDDKTFIISNKSGKGRGKVYKTALYDKDKQLKNVRIKKEMNNKEYELSAKFENGGLYNVTKKESVTIPNGLGKEKFNNPDLFPAKIFKPEFDYKSIEGEKTYYSNGAIEKNIFSRDGIDYETIFNPEGDLIKVKMPDKEITMKDNRTQEIKEIFEDGKEKTTTYYLAQDNSEKHNGVDVLAEKDGMYMLAGFDKNNKPVSYEEGSIDENGEQEFSHAYFYNDNGRLETAI